MKKDFQIAKEEFNRLNNTEKLEFVLSEIYFSNGITDKDFFLPIFIGKVERKEKKDGTGKIKVIKNILPLFKDIPEDLQNPYMYEALEMKANSSSDEGDVIFVVTYSDYFSPYKLLSPIFIFSAEKLGINIYSVDDSIANTIKDNTEFWPYKKQIETCLDKRHTLIESKSKLNAIKGEFEAKEKDLKKINDLINEKAPEGIDKLKADLRELEERRQKIAPEGIMKTARKLKKIETDIGKLGEGGITGAEEKIKRLKEEEIQLNDEVALLRRLKEEEKTLNTFCSLWSIQENTISFDSSNHLHLEDDPSLDKFLSRMEYDYSKNKHDVLGFLMALNTTQLIALCGKPGIGKSTFVVQMCKALGAKCHMIQVQNNWTEKGDILGYYNPINRTYQSTDFLDALIQARDEEELCKDKTGNERNARLHIICLDEMNLARIEYYYAYFLSLMQLDSKEIHLLPADIIYKIRTFIKKYPDIKPGEEGQIEDKDKDDIYLLNLIRYRSFTLPQNVRIVGTMNIDHTTNFLSPKVIDRSYFIELSDSSSSNYVEKEDDKKFFPVSEFALEECAGWDKKNEFVMENKRFKKYASQMCSIYRIAKFSKQMNLSELLILSKIMPAMTIRLPEDSEDKIKQIIEKNKVLNDRYTKACNTGEELDGSKTGFSYFGGT